MKSVEAGVGIEPAYTDLQCDRTKKCPDFSGHKVSLQLLWHKSTAQFWHSDQGAKHTSFT
jgi:hypothetical protein